MLNGAHLAGLLEMYKIYRQAHMNSDVCFFLCMPKGICLANCDLLTESHENVANHTAIG